MPHDLSCFVYATKHQSKLADSHITLAARCAPVCALSSLCFCTLPHTTQQSKKALVENLHENKGDLKLRMNSIKKTDDSLAVKSLGKRDTWSVQLFRSIDSGERCCWSRQNISIGLMRSVCH